MNTKPLAIFASLVLLLAAACSDVPTEALELPDASPLADAGLDMTPITTPLPIKARGRRLIILHTNDLHDHLRGSGPGPDYTAAAKDDKTSGGFARLAALIAKERAAAEGAPVLLVDAGDFSMGSLFSWLSLDVAPALSLMQRMGYDAITLGNHEFDWTPDGLAGALAAALKGGFSVPVVAANIVFSATDTADDNLEQLAGAGVIQPRTLKTLDNGLKVGIFGLLGTDAPLADPVTFKDAIITAELEVKELRDQGADVVICLSHGGVDAKGTGVDADLAAAVPGIDVIVSGHTHVALKKPVKVGQTLIVQAGENGEQLGRLELVVDATGSVSRASGKLIDVDDAVAADGAIQQLIDGYISALDAVLKPAGLAYGQVVAETAYDLTRPRFAEGNLGDLVTDAYRAVIDTLQPAESLLMSFEANGLIRDPVRSGESGQIWFADLYRALPLGAGPDSLPGYPLVTFYLTGKEIKQGLELIANAEDVLQDDDFFLQVSGVTVTYDRRGAPFDRILSVKRSSGEALDLTDETSCHKVGTNYYLAIMLSMVKQATGGALVVEPKEQDCKTQIADFSQRIVDSDPATSGVQELKQWQALLHYVSQLPDTDSDGVPDLPALYAKPQQRIIAK
jgi:5'-nucleotidase/UDP-sugar diphosphatase